MHKWLLTGVVLAGCLLMAVSTLAFEKRARRLKDSGMPYNLSQDCILESYNICSGWVWVFNDDQGAEWGAVLDINDCPGGCPAGGAVTDIWFWGYCSPDAPAILDGIDINRVPYFGSLCHGYYSPLWESGPISVYSCVTGDRWTHVMTPYPVCLRDDEFVCTFKWGPSEPRMRLATDNGIANLYCWMGYVGTYPGCAETYNTCAGWGTAIPPQNTYVYVTDFNGDTILDDLCDIYGAPYPLAFPYVGGYGYIPNNLLVIVGLDCYYPSSVENTSWGHVKALYDD